MAHTYNPDSEVYFQPDPQCQILFSENPFKITRISREVFKKQNVCFIGWFDNILSGYHGFRMSQLGIITVDFVPTMNLWSAVV